MILRQLFKCLVERRVNRLGGDAIELFADVVVGGDALHAEQRLAGASVVGFLKLSLMVKERRGLDEEHGKSGHADVVEWELGVGAGAWIRNLSEQIPQVVDQGIDHEIHGRKLYQI